MTTSEAVARRYAGDPRSLSERIADLSPKKLKAMMGFMRDPDIVKYWESWAMWARAAQLPPAWHWSVWLLLAGRGFGKTRAGAEWVHSVAQTPNVRIALVGATEDEVRRVMIEGSSGILACSRIGEGPVWEPSKGVLTWPNGAQAFVYSGANADGLRGPEHDFAWCDEIAKWAHGDATWDNLRMGMRRGQRPQIVVTTTPRAKALLKRILAMPGTAVTRGRTRDNVHLPARFVADMTGEYGGTRYGRQELDGELIDDVAGALWTRAGIERCRVRSAPDLRRVRGRGDRRTAPMRWFGPSRN